MILYITQEGVPIFHCDFFAVLTAKKLCSLSQRHSEMKNDLLLVCVLVLLLLLLRWRLKLKCKNCMHYCVWTFRFCFCWIHLYINPNYDCAVCCSRCSFKDSDVMSTLVWHRCLLWHPTIGLCPSVASSFCAICCDVTSLRWCAHTAVSAAAWHFHVSLWPYSAVTRSSCDKYSRWVVFLLVTQAELMLAKKRRIQSITRFSRWSQ